jgi:hypothetical protein
MRTTLVLSGWMCKERDTTVSENVSVGGKRYAGYIKKVWRHGKPRTNGIPFYCISSQNIFSLFMLTRSACIYATFDAGNPARYSVV